MLVHGRVKGLLYHGCRLVYFVYNTICPSLIAMELEKLLLNNKNPALCKTNMSPEHYFKCNKQQCCVIILHFNVLSDYFCLIQFSGSSQLPSFKPRGVGHESANYGLNYTRSIQSERAH